MQYSILIDAGCTVDAVPYKVLDLEASKLNFVGPEMKFTPVMAVLLVLENAPVGVVPFVFPTGWNVPVMFGSEHHRTSQPMWGLGWRLERRRSIEERFYRSADWRSTERRKCLL